MKAPLITSDTENLATIDKIGELVDMGLLVSISTENRESFGKGLTLYLVEVEPMSYSNDSHKVSVCSNDLKTSVNIIHGFFKEEK